MPRRSAFSLGSCRLTFHAADAIDRVLQISQYRRAGALTASQMLDEMELVHAGPVKTFQDQVLREAGLS